MGYLESSLGFSSELRQTVKTYFLLNAELSNAYSRRAIGWALDRTLEDELTLAALRMALEQRIPAPGLVHHSDRGVQYASQD
jgi:transposase InsO family protein